jgi:hypothetical protein
VTPGADIIGWQIERVGNTLYLICKTNGKLIKDMQYITYLKTPDGVTHVYSQSESSESPGSTSFTTQISLADLGNPPVISFSAETKQDIVLDNSAWEFALLDYSNVLTHTPTH